jgi:hypothetical protein
VRRDSLPITPLTSSSRQTGGVREPRGPPSHEHADKLCLSTITLILFILFILFILSEDEPVSPTQSQRI